MKLLRGDNYNTTVFGRSIIMDKLWEQFCISGKIADYLLYKAGESGEEYNADNNKRDSNP